MRVAYRNPVDLAPGLAATCTFAVGDDDTALALGSGDVAVLGTPRVVAMCEQATLEVLAGHLAPGTTTVGMRVQLDHLSPTPVGQKVRAEATLERVEGRRLVFSVAVHDERCLIAAGRITRVIVDVDRFLDKAG